MFASNSAGAWSAELQGTALLGLWAGHSYLTHAWNIRVLPATAAFGMAEAPIRWFAAHASTGVIALVGSFALFAAGAWFAWHRKAATQVSDSAVTPR